MDDKIKTILAGIAGLEERTKNSDCGTEFRNGQNRAYVLVKELIYQQFPELQESADERIRKALVKTFEKKLEIGFEWTEFGIPNRSVLDWLEKQKEQKITPDWMPKFLDELRSKKNYFDWDEHRDIEGKILAIIKWIAPDYFNAKEIANEILDHFNTGNAEWFNWFNARFKSLRPQPKQDWSEEDEEMISSIEQWLHEEKPEYVEKELAWLKSLRSKSSWKPSEKEMQALSWAINYLVDIEQGCASTLALLKFNLKELTL